MSSRDCGSHWWKFSGNPWPGEPDGGRPDPEAAAVGISYIEPDFTVPFPKVPEVGLELARLTRDVKVQETLVSLLTQQLEQAKIAEAKDMPVGGWGEVAGARA